MLCASCVLQSLIVQEGSRIPIQRATRSPSNEPIWFYLIVAICSAALQLVICLILITLRHSFQRSVIMQIYCRLK